MEGDFVYLLWSHAGAGGCDSLSIEGVLASESDAETWRHAVTHGVRWWEMYEVGQPEQGRLDSSELARA